MGLVHSRHHRSFFVERISIRGNRTNSALLSCLFLLLVVLGMFPARGTVLLERQLLAARLALERVVMIAGLFADEEHRFRFFLTLGHRRKHLFRTGLFGKPTIVHEFTGMGTEGEEKASGSLIFANEH